TEKKLHPVNLIEALEKIVSEKRLEHGDLPKVQITNEITQDNFSLFAFAEPTELKRILSNVINNSIESLENQSGMINIQLFSHSDTCVIEVNDNGRGIPASLVPRVTEAGFTYGKNSGSGLGLHHAVTKLKEWNGSLEIASRENEGTKVKLIFPQASKPLWA